ncbi:V-type ATP synthase subunit I domain-containing protein [Winogradskyella thalassocola]|uniref:Uncharacterized protein n=1 Tax=Winogradskyella thalassocola TaxID=262004 RepID=A0A1G8B981_9FLAO|nr:hypothetical protein [Winogradskyella thalassocola]SDH29738.1 hypothetical protein SAMN04489796_102190 [Winogradskyella thalassocola]
MKNLIVLIFSSLCLVALHGQSKPISDEQWITIVDHTNAIVTKSYIEKLKLNEKESLDYSDNLKVRLNKSSLNYPLPFDSLEILLKQEFKKTLEKVSFKINETKSKEKDLDTLFNSIGIILKDVKEEKLIDSEPLSILHKDIDRFINPKVDENVEKNANVTAKIEVIPTRGKSIFTLSNAVIVFLLALLIIFIIRSINKGKKIRELEALRKEERNVNKTYSLEIPKLNNEISSLRKEITRLKNELKKVKYNSNDNFNSSPPSSYSENETENIKEWDTSIPKPVLTSFYAGKSNPNRIFVKTTQEILDQETIFKFTYIDSTKTSAEFEVVLVNDFMMRQIINSPDDFLYRVCNNANSNQDFQRTIITERKGIARLVNGEWVVSESDKALIKFQ